jgi:hypothetical protein
MEYITNFFKTGWQYIRASKTLLFNFALGLAGGIEAYSGFLRGLFESDQAFGMFMVAIATTGEVLRFVTTQSLRSKIREERGMDA